MIIPLWAVQLVGMSASAVVTLRILGRPRTGEDRAWFALLSIIWVLPLGSILAGIAYGAYKRWFRGGFKTGGYIRVVPIDEDATLPDRDPKP